MAIELWGQESIATVMSQRLPVFMLAAMVSVGVGAQSSAPDGGFDASAGNPLRQGQNVLSDLRAIRSITPKFAAFLRDDELQPGGASAATYSPWRFVIADRLFARHSTALSVLPPSAAGSDAVSVGVGYRISDELMVGATFDIGRDSSSQPTLSLESTTGDAGNENFSLFGSFERRNFFVDGLIGTGRGDYNALLRPNQLSLAREDVDGDRDDEHVVFGLGLGYRIADGPFSITPSLRFDYLNVDVADGENTLVLGDNGALRPGQQSIQSKTSSLGGQIEYQVDQPWGSLIPHISLEWVHEFDDQARIDDDQFARQTASLQESDGSSALTIDPTLDDQDYFNLGLGFSARFGHRSAAFLSYEKVFGKKEPSSYSVTGGVRFEFK